jgi:predicted component of type VI protein secretion system
MPVKLQVVKEGADEGEPADYLFEQDRITIGRGSNNDLTLPDQKVSTEHAEIRHEEGTYLLSDRESKNKTYVDGRRVGEKEPYVLESGDIFRVGDFKIEFAPLFMPSSEQTAHAEENENANPFEKDARQLAAALEGIAETYKFVPDDQRDADFAAAVEEHLDADIGQEEGVQRVLDAVGGSTGPDGQAAQASGASATSDEAVASVLDTLLASVTRMISIPNYFWREFTGDTLDHPPEKQALYDADVDELRERLLGDGVSDRERTERLDHLSEAVDSLVAHNMAMLSGYKKAVMAGSKELLERVDPADAVQEAEDADDGGGMMGGFFGDSGETELEKLDQAWNSLYQGEWGELESELFRPTYIDAYVDRMAQTWEIDKAELLQADER